MFCKDFIFLEVYIIINRFCKLQLGTIYCYPICFQIYLIIIISTSLANISKIVFPLGNMREEISWRKPIERQSVCTHSYTQVL